MPIRSYHHCAQQLSFKIKERNERQTIQRQTLYAHSEHAQHIAYRMRLVSRAEEHLTFLLIESIATTSLELQGELPVRPT